jgi:hypothetical protein
MRKDEAVVFMSEIIEAENTKFAQHNNMPEDQIKEFNNQSRDRLYFLNNLVYDALKVNGVIIEE